MFILLTLPAASATYMWSPSCGSGTAASILEGSLIGAPLVFFDLVAFLAVSFRAELRLVRYVGKDTRASSYVVWK
jgi:hypothetical protein